MTGKNTQPAPAPQPVEPQQPQPQPQPMPYQGQPAPQNVQYVVQEQSLNGLGGWLAFWMTIFTLSGLIFIVAFFGAIENGVEESASVLLMVFAPILAIAYITSTVLIALRKKIARWVSVGSIGLATLYSVISVIVAASEADDMPITGVVAGILTSVVLSGLMALYFIVSKRVAQTLIR
jgi:hypothetical protein